MAKFLSLPGPQNGNNDSVYLTGLYRGLKDLLFVKASRTVPRIQEALHVSSKYESEVIHAVRDP